jgi:HSP20 family molecular chaperone IbpA
LSRIFEFPTEIDTDNVRASLENGKPKVRASKAAAARRG